MDRRKRHLVKIRLHSRLPFVSIALQHNNKQVILDNVLLDTGSVGAIFSVEKLLTLGIQLEPHDIIKQIRGVGGVEFVFTKTIDKLSLGQLSVTNFEIEAGAMDYGFQLDGILGINFVLQVGAILDFSQLKITN